MGWWANVKRRWIMDALFKAIDWLWNLKAFKNHRTQIAQGLLTGVAVLIGYQGLAVDAQLIGSGIDLPDLPGRGFVFLSPLSAYFAGKVKQFATEHQTS